MSLRSSRVACWALVAVWLSLGPGCAEDAKKLTQIVVVVDSDLPVPDRLDGLHIEVSGTKPMPEIDTPIDEDHKLPRTLGLVYSGGKLGPVRVLARGTHGGTTVVERVADVWFKKDSTLKLALPLTRACLAEKKLGCTAEQTCDQGICIASAMASLPVFDGKDGSYLPDAGMFHEFEPLPDSGAAYGGRDASQDAAADAATDSEAGMSGTIVCTIVHPTDGDTFYEGDEVTFEGNCVDADSNALGVRWVSTLEEGNLGTQTTFKKSSLNVGTHEISLCANNTNVCAVPPLQITVQALPEISATISSLAQSGAAEGMYSAAADLIAHAEASGALPLTLRWVDSIAGELGSNQTCTLRAPMLAGRHMLSLVVTDARGRTASAERGYVVHTPDHAALFEAYAAVNSVLDVYGTISALASEGAYHYVGTENGFVLQVAADASQMTSPIAAPTAKMPPRPSVRDVFIHHSSNAMYLATSADVQVCDISNATLNNNCTKLMLGGFGPAVPRSVRRVTSDALDYLAVGTSTGIWIGALNMLDKGSLRDNNTMFYGTAESAGKLWLGASTGLTGYTLDSGGGVSGSPQKFPGASGGLTGLVASANSVWATLSSGFTCYDMGTKKWTSWTTAYTQAAFGRLVNNEVRSIAITHPVIDGAARDVIWLATASGLSRFDAAIPSFTTYTQTDGLPENSVLEVLGLPSNEVLLATPSALVIHHGQ